MILNQFGEPAHYVHQAYEPVGDPISVARQVLQIGRELRLVADNGCQGIAEPHLVAYNGRQVGGEPRLVTFNGGQGGGEPFLVTGDAGHIGSELSLLAQQELHGSLHLIRRHRLEFHEYTPALSEQPHYAIVLPTPRRATRGPRRAWGRGEPRMRGAADVDAGCGEAEP